MTTLIQRMREELVRRNYAATTIHSYLKAVEHFQQHIDKPLDQLGPDDLRSYHAHLLGDRKLAVNTVVLNICALRFLYIKVLKRRDMKEDLLYTYAYPDVKITFRRARSRIFSRLGGEDRVTESLYQRCAHRDSQCFLAARNAMQYRGHSKPLPVPKQDPPFAAVRSAGPNNFTMRTFDANTGDAWFHGGDAWEYEGRRERVPVPGRVC